MYKFYTMVHFCFTLIPTTRWHLAIPTTRMKINHIMKVLTLEIPFSSSILLPHITTMQNTWVSIELLNDDCTRFDSVNNLFELSDDLVYLYLYLSKTT